MNATNAKAINAAIQMPSKNSLTAGQRRLVCCHYAHDELIPRSWNYNSHMSPNYRLEGCARKLREIRYPHFGDTGVLMRKTATVGSRPRLRGTSQPGTIADRSSVMPLVIWST